MINLPKKGKNKFLFFLTILVAFFIPLSLLILGLFVFNKTNPIIKILPEEEVKAEVRLTPSQILANKAKYNLQEIVIRGRVKPEPVVCERKECPANDACCGCPTERDLILTDTGKVLTSEEGTLKLVDTKLGKSFCSRRSYTCDYDCGDWVKGAIYDVSGKFFADSPPPGWQMSLNYYFQVESKELVKKVSFKETFGNFINEMKNKIASFKTSGQYVLP
jgi:hypothetical protein